MQAITRRRLVLTGAAVVAISPVVAHGLRDGMLSDALSVLREHFGDAIAGHADTLAFAMDFVTRSRQGAGPIQRWLAEVRFDLGFNALRPDPVFEGQVVSAFLQSTNVFLHLEDGRPFHYVGLVDRHTPCGNMLSAMQA